MTASRSRPRTASPRSSAGARATRSASSSWQSIGELKAVDAKTFTIMLKEPFGLVLEALGKPSSNVPFMMPKRVAETDPNKQIDDYTGSGPFIFKKDEWKPGEKVVYVKNTKYKPRAEPPSMLAGGKVVKIDRVEWIAITDPLTAVNALQQGEIDLIEIAGARPLPDAEGRQEHRAVRLERARAARSSCASTTSIRRSTT